MAESTRRNFLKKNLIGGAVVATGIPFLYGSSDNPSMNETIPFKLDNKDYESIDWSQIRAEFLFPADRNYLNTASLGPSPKVVVDSICESIRELDTNCSHGHHLAEKMHEKVAAFLNVTPDEIAITRNATEGMNIIARSLRLQKGDEIIITTHEHVGGAAPWLALQKDGGVVVKLVDLDLSGTNNLERIKALITKKTKAIAFSHITCTTGMLLPAKEIAKLCREKGIYSCVDGAQALGMFPIDLSDMDPDFYTTSGHKWLFGPKGTGVLYIKKSIREKYDPTYVGAYSDKTYDLNSLTMTYRLSAQREEYGTRNAPNIIGLGTAIDFMEEIGMENVAKRGRELANYFRKGLTQFEAIEILTPVEENYSASILTFKIAGLDNLELNQKLNSEKGIRLRGIYENDLNAIRVSFAVFNSFEEIDQLLVALSE